MPSTRERGGRREGEAPGAIVIPPTDGEAMAVTRDAMAEATESGGCREGRTGQGGAFEGGWSVRVDPGAHNRSNRLKPLTRLGKTDSLRRAHQVSSGMEE